MNRQKNYLAARICLALIVGSGMLFVNLPGLTKIPAIIAFVIALYYTATIGNRHPYPDKSQLSLKFEIGMDQGE